MDRPRRPVALVVGRNVAKIRNEVGLTQDQLAARLTDVDDKNLRKIERGKRNITIQTVEKLANALGVPLARLFAEDAE